MWRLQQVRKRRYVGKSHTEKKKNLLIGEEVDTEIKSEPCTILTPNAMFLFL